MHEAELGRPRACLVPRRAADRHRALPDDRALARAARVADAQPRHPVARAAPAGLARLRAELDQAERRVGGEERRHAGERVVAGDLRVVVEEEQQLAPHVGHARVAPGGDAVVALQRHDPHARGHAGGVASVADDDHVERHVALLEQRLDRAP